MFDDDRHVKETEEDKAVREGVYRVAAAEITQIVERIERCEVDKAAIADDIKEFYSEAKSRGYDVKALRRLIALRKRDKDELAEEECALALYREALGV